MKYILIIVLFFSSVLHGEYLRTIRIASFATEAESQQSLAELQNFIAKYENIIDLQEEWNFEFKARRSGRFYITLVEPFTQRKILQEVIDTLRIEYQDVYVTSIKNKAIKTIPIVKKEVIEVIVVEEEIIVKEAEEEIIVEIPSVEIVIQETKELVVVVPQKQEVIPEVKELQINQDEVIIGEVLKEDPSALNEDFWPWLSLFLFMLSAYFLRSMFKYKRETEVYFNSELIHKERYSQLGLEIKDREKYLAHASHELRAPMTAIMGLTHLVLDSDLKKQEKEYIKQIENSATNLLNIVNDILDVSKIKAGALHIEKVEFNINDILEYVLNIIAIQAKDNNINCLIDINREVPARLIGDPLRLGQVLINLLGNAVKFTKDGEVSLSVQKLSNYGDSVSIQFCVSDDGIGMNDEQLQQIFQSFSQASESTTRKFGGTGLGLSISQELVRMMNGEIKVKSEVGKGTSFSFELLFELKDHLNKRQYRLPSSKFLNKRILLIDGSNKNVMQLISMLGYFKYRTHTIPSLGEAVLDESMEFDIVIINKNQLSRVTIEKLLVMQKQQGFKIVILSDLFSSLHHEVLKNISVDSYLKIPFNQQNILNMLIDLYVKKKLDSRSRLKTSKNLLQDVINKKILIAEDNVVNHKVISGLMAQTGIELSYVLNGKEAVDILLSGAKFDLILMDISMPIMDGFEATKEIRKHSKFDDIPILALTADVMDEAINKAMLSGMQGHISKPIIIDIFYKKIYDVFTTPKKTKEKTKPMQDFGLEKLDDEYAEISISVGLERYNQDKDFYVSILKDFKKMYTNSAFDLEELCRLGNYKEARHKAMDIKDVSLSIGAYKLCESAATMEYNLEKGPRSNWVKLIAFYEIELGKLFKDIDKYLKKSHS